MLRFDEKNLWYQTRRTRHSLSHRAELPRLTGMKQRTGEKGSISTGKAVLLGAVLVHFAVTGAHGFAHAHAKVALSPGTMMFVFWVIVIGPILGIVAQRTTLPRGGAWAIAGMMAAALAFGLANHFLLPGPDHVAHVAGPWQALFGITAGTLALTEAFAAVVAVWCATRTLRRSVGRQSAAVRLSRPCAS